MTHSLFREEGLMGSFSGDHSLEEWWLNWEGCYSNGSQSWSLKKENRVWRGGEIVTEREGLIHASTESPEEVTGSESK